MKITDEQIVSAVISSRTNKEAAAAVGLSQSQLYERMQAPEYRDLLNSVISAQLESVSGRLRDKMTAAVDVIASLAENEDVPPSVRLAAASAIIQNYTRLADISRTARHNIRIDKQNTIFDGIVDSMLS